MSNITIHAKALILSIASLILFSDGVPPPTGIVSDRPAAVQVPAPKESAPAKATQEVPAPPASKDAAQQETPTTTPRRRRRSPTDVPPAPRLMVRRVDALTVAIPPSDPLWEKGTPMEVPVIAQIVTAPDAHRGDIQQG